MLDFDVIDSWYAEPKRMNYGKKTYSTTIQIHLSDCLVT